MNSQRFSATPGGFKRITQAKSKKFSETLCAVAVENQVVHKPQLYAFADNLGSHGANRKNDDARQVVLPSPECAVCVIDMSDASPSFVDRRDVVPVLLVRLGIDDERTAKVAQRPPTKPCEVYVSLSEELAAPKTAWLVFRAD